MRQNHKIKAFTLIELMIALAIILILAAIAVPSYHLYIRRSYLTEANATLALTKASLEFYLDDKKCYTSAVAHPATIPSDGLLTWDPAPGGWAANRLNVLPERQVRFQYEVYASNAYDPANFCGPVVNRNSIGNQGCVTGSIIANQLLDPTLFPLNWYLIVARGDLDGDGVTSTLIQGPRANNVIMCDELE